VGTKKESLGGCLGTVENGYQSYQGENEMFGDTNKIGKEKRGISYRCSRATMLGADNKATRNGRGGSREGECHIKIDNSKTRWHKLHA